MKKLLVLGLSACLLFSFTTGSAFAASQTSNHVKKKVVHAPAVKKKNTIHTLSHAKKKVVHPAGSSKKTLTHAKAKTMSTKNNKSKIGT